MKVYSRSTIEEVPPIAWKNGGGATRTLAIGPSGAGLEDFAWRVSLAEIEADGEFSLFEGIDRTILLYRGCGIVMRSPAWTEHRLMIPFEPFEFRGEDPVWCGLLDGPSTDLNLMVRRCSATGRVAVRRLGRSRIEIADEILLLCAVGCGEVEFADGAKMLVSEGEFIRITGAVDAIFLQIDDRDAVFVCVMVQTG